MRQLAFLSLVCLAPVLAGSPLLTAYRVAKPPVMDGKLTDGCWRAAIASSPFVLATGNGFPEEQTVARLCWDDAYLYVGIEAGEPLLDPVLNMLHKVKAEGTGRDANVFGDDCVELFLQPPDRPYLHFAANSATGSYEGRGKDKSWNCDWQCQTSRGKTSYTVELAIPFAALGGKPVGDWYWNVTRHRPQAKEYSTWSGLQGAFHQPDQFGLLRFVRTGPGASPVQIEQTEKGEKISLRTTAPAVLEVRFLAPVEAAESRSGKGDLELMAAAPAAAIAAGRYEFVQQLSSGKALLAESAPVTRSLAAGVAPFTLVATRADAKVFVNGEPVAQVGGKAELKLSGGMNVIAIEATKTSAGCSLLPSVSQGDARLPLAWRVAAAAPNDWRAAVPNREWKRVPSGTEFWSGDDASRCFAVAAIFVDQSAPPLFPKSSRFLVPQGSTQLLRAYLPMSPEVLTDDYQLAVEVPSRLRCTALEPFGAQDLAIAKTEDVAGQRRHFLSFGSVPGSGMELSLRWGDAGGSTLAYQPALTAGGTHDWRHLKTTVTAPAGAVSARPLVIKWQNRGYVGAFWVDNIVFRREDSDANLLKMGTFDEPTWKRSFPTEGVGGSKCFKVVAKPDQTHRQQACWVDDKETVPVESGARYVVELDAKCDHLGSRDARPFVGLLLQDEGTDQPTGDVPLRVYASALEGSLLTWPRQGIVRLLPPLRDVRPKRARIAPCYYGARFSNPKVEAAYAENCYRSGITWTYGRTANGVVPHLAPRGHKVILSIGWEPWSVPAASRDFAEGHPELRALQFDGKRSAHTLCPTWLLADGDAVLEELEKWLLAAVEKGDYAGANWDLEQPVVDPPTFCVCPRCLAAFRTWAKRPADAKLDPKTLLAEHRDQWVDFRCTQNAEMAGRLRAMLRKSPHPVEFSLYSGYQGTRTKEHYGVDWARMAPHLDFAIAGYGGGEKSIEDTVRALNGVPFMGGEMWYLSDTSDARSTPRYETWRNRLLRQFAQSGGNGCLIWYLPPMDGGAFYATSEAAELIAKYEDFFHLDQRCDDRLKVTGLPTSDWAAFAHDGKVLVMLLNFAESEKTASVVLKDRTVERKLAPYGAEVIVE
jgi:hypothetical protein